MIQANEREMTEVYHYGLAYTKTMKLLMWEVRTPTEIWRQLEDGKGIPPLAGYERGMRQALKDYEEQNGVAGTDQ